MAECKYGVWEDEDYSDPLPPPPWWDPDGEGLCCIAAYSPEEAESLASSYLDLTDNGNDMTLGVVPGWDPVNGWDLDGVSWLNTGVIPDGDQAFSILLKYSSLSHIRSGTLLGIQSGFSQVRLGHDHISMVMQYASGGSSKQKAPALTSGVLGIAGASPV